MPIPQEKAPKTPLRPLDYPPVGTPLEGVPPGSYVVTPGGLKLPAWAYDPRQGHMLILAAPEVSA